MSLIFSLKAASELLLLLRRLFFIRKNNFFNFLEKAVQAKFFRHSLVQGLRLKCHRQISQTNFLLFGVFFLLKVGQPTTAATTTTTTTATTKTSTSTISVRSIGKKTCFKIELNHFGKHNKIQNEIWLILESICHALHLKRITT